ncbi:tryptophan halogenase family protein [Catenovulum sediminis]|uniref:Tryptophan halogenase family protein n=2 Tax=Catenovulum sediminis TaxID=1740262 RepID=A0ABV1RF49_9ALTE|nr:tryptophan halogenase family protein [Catenovulum sediminis]
MNEVTKVIVVGGGSAGWLTAARIASYHKTKDSANRQVEVLLIESSEVPPVGVGEGTWPTMRNTLKAIGLSEKEFLKECDASFKQGAKFVNWKTAEENDFYYHPLILPQGFPSIDLSPYWALDIRGKQAYSEAVCFQEAICEKGLAPKMATTPDYESVANYAYHLDAGKFSTLLKKHAISQLGVKHVVDHVTAVNSHTDGRIRSLLTKQHGELNGDLFVDCSGFSSILLGQHYQIPFEDKNDVLFIDSALALHVPYQSPEQDIASHTISTAQTAGWIWDIGLPTRRGIGHVYSSAHTNEEHAAQALLGYVKSINSEAAKVFDYRKIAIRSGHRRRFWHKNCVAVGLSAGFLEPLEASALILVEMSASFIAEQLPRNIEQTEIIAKRFNDSFLYRWSRIIDFLKLHYCLSKRTDSSFWLDNQNLSSIPQTLQEQLKLWRTRAPSSVDFSSTYELFPAASYLYVLYGMGFETDFSQYRYLYQEQEKANALFAQNERMIRQAVANLPKNRELLQNLTR